jgi:hypothetical protein
MTAVVLYSSMPVRPRKVRFVVRRQGFEPRTR